MEKKQVTDDNNTDTKTNNNNNAHNKPLRKPNDDYFESK